MALSEEERIKAGGQMNEQERNQVMLDFSKTNTTAIDEPMEQIPAEHQGFTDGKRQ